jgi:hypothetical protein
MFGQDFVFYLKEIQIAKHRRAIFFFIGEPQIQRGLTPSFWLATCAEISALQALSVQCQESPGRIIMVDLPTVSH